MVVERMGMPHLAIFPSFHPRIAGAALAAYSTYKVAAAIRSRIRAVFSHPVPTLTFTSPQISENRELRSAFPADVLEAPVGRSFPTAAKAEPKAEEGVESGTPSSPSVNRLGAMEESGVGG